jgi:two-component system OmpR family sensor kinase
MKGLRLTPLGSRITIAALSIGAGTSIVVYVWVVAIGGHAEAGGPILVGALIALLMALGLGIYWARVVTQRVKRIEDAARAVADGDFAARIPVDSSGQLGQLARTFNEMQRRLAELDSARKQFIANASHELRTPIFSLGGFVELLDEEDPNPEERAEFVRTMRRQIERLTKLTADLLNLSQLDAGGVELAIGSVDLSSLARDVAREFGARADLRGSRLELRAPDRPVIAVADPERVRQIIRILLDNALTHTPEGTSVTMTIYSVDQRAELTVSDDGTGIPQRAQKRIFERFFTADSAGGSGLGLAIARELVQRMDGQIAISSSRRFTAFTLGLPLAPRGTPAPLPADPAKATA